MTTPAVTIAASDINTELAVASDTKLTLNDTGVRTLAGSGYTTNESEISMDILRSKSSRKFVSGISFSF
jgi:hypothetical protein